MPDRTPQKLPPLRGSVAADGFYRMSAYELVTGWVGGFDPVDVPADAAARPPRARLEEELLLALRRAPCVVAFSGGRDSSALLAVATHVARREGLPDPIPATHDFTGLGAADETEWQELVIRHLGLQEWVRFREVDAFDVLGARARAGLLRYGVLWPGLLHCHAPAVELAAGGGSLVIGEGGDEVLGLQRITPLTYLMRTRRRPSRDVVRLLLGSLGPAPLRRASQRRQLGAGNIHPWLRRDVARHFEREHAHEICDAPLSWDRAVVRHAGRRAVRAMMGNSGRILSESDVALHVPFLSPTFVGSLAVAGGRRGYITRTGMMIRFFGDLLPDRTLRREAKARFNAVAVGAPSRAFMTDWNGEGLDADLIDVEAFREACLGDMPMFGTQMLLQTAWLALQPSSVPAAGVPR